MSGYEGGQSPQGADEWVVERHFKIPETNHELVTYWYGPEYGFGRTSGPTVSSAARFSTRKEAERALRSIFKRPSNWKRQGYAPVRLTSVLPDSGEEG